MSRLRWWRFQFLFTAIFTCIILQISFTQTASAATNPISVSNPTDTISFPTSLDFQVSVHDRSSTIKHATIYLQYNSEGYSEQHEVDIPHPQSILRVSWREDISNNYSAVGTLVTYYWHLVDTVGNTYDSNALSFSISDTRFTWQHLKQGQIQINWYDRPGSFGQIILAQANKALQHIQENLGGTLTHAVNLWIYTKALDFHNALPPQSHEWVGGIAFPTLNQASIVVYSPNDETLIRDMPHELTHLVFHQISGPGTNTPLWFDEGLAVYDQFYHEPEMNHRFQEALSAHNLIRLDDITYEFPPDGLQAYLAYAESWKLIDYMYTTFGKAKMMHLIHDLNNQGVEWNTDLAKDIGVRQDQLENQWRISLGQSGIPVQNPSSPNALNGQTNKAVFQPPTSDPLAPLLLTAGLLMVIFPLFGLSGLIFYWRNNRRHNSLLHQAPQPEIQALPHTPSGYNTGALFPPTYSSGREYNSYLPEQQAPQE